MSFNYRGGGYNGARGLVCFVCNGSGHISRDCPSSGGGRGAYSRDYRDNGRKAAMMSGDAKAARIKHCFNKMCFKAGVGPELSYNDLKTLLRKDKRFKKVKSEAQRKTLFREFLGEMDKIKKNKKAKKKRDSSSSSSSLSDESSSSSSSDESSSSSSSSSDEEERKKKSKKKKDKKKKKKKDKKRKKESKSCILLLSVLLPRRVLEGEWERNLKKTTEDESKRYGKAKQVLIHRERHGVEEDAEDHVKIFVEFSKPSAVKVAKMALEGRSFKGQKLSAQEYNQEKFDQQDFSG